MRRLARRGLPKVIFFFLALIVFPQWITAQNSGSEPFWAPTGKSVPGYPFSFPNPFGLSPDCKGSVGGVCFAFDPSVDGIVTLRIFDVSGSVIRRITYSDLATGDTVPDQIHWDGITTGGFQVANGVYLYRIEVKALVGANETFSGRCYKFSYP